MDDSIPVEIEEAVHHLPRHVGDLLLREAFSEVHNDGVQGAAVTILDEHLETRDRYSNKINIQVNVMAITRHSGIMMSVNDWELHQSANVNK